MNAVVVLCDGLGEIHPLLTHLPRTISSSGTAAGRVIPLPRATLAGDKWSPPEKEEEYFKRRYQVTPRLSYHVAHTWVAEEDCC